MQKKEGNPIKESLRGYSSCKFNLDIFDYILFETKIL